jgi:tRNA pseudouridine55 synthase
VTLSPRTVEIVTLERDGPTAGGETEFWCECGKGTYVRALARDLGRALHSHGHVKALRRLAVGPFREDQMIPLERLQELWQRGRGQEALAACLRPVETALDDIPALALTETEAGRMRSGQAISLLSRSQAERVRDLEPGDIVCAMAGDKLVAIARFEAGELRPVRVLNL